MIKSISAVVVGANLNGLGVVRSLARGGVPTTLVDTTRWRAAMWSRFGRARVLDQRHGRSLLDGLLTAKKKLTGRPILFLTDETAVDIVSENREELARAFRFQLPAQNVVAMLQNKARFHEFSEQHDLPVPRTIILKPDTPLAALSTLPFPVVIKPARRPLDGTEQLHFVATLNEAESLCRRLLETMEELIVQEWISGPDNNVCFSHFHFGHKPENLRIFTGRKISRSPAMVGDTSFCFAAPEVMDRLEPLIAKYLDLTEFHGLGSLEFKWDPQQRRYVIIGLTVGRTDWQEEIATLSGVNLPLAAYRDESDLPPIPLGEVNCTVAWRESWLSSDRSAVLPPSMHVYDGYWRLNDPLPGLIHDMYVACSKIYRKIFKPIFGGTMVKQLQRAAGEKYRIFLKPMFSK